MWQRQLKNASWMNLTANDAQFSTSTFNLYTSLTIHNLTRQYFGMYRLITVNELGNHTQIFNVQQHDVPDVPTNFSTSCLSTECTLQWKPESDGGLKQTFDLSYTKLSNGTLSRVTIPDNGDVIMKHHLLNLIPGTKYSATLFSTNAKGRSKGEANITFTTTIDSISFTANNQQDNIASIAGGTVGSIVAVLIIAVIGITVYRKRLTRNPDNGYQDKHLYQNVLKPLGERQSSHNGKDTGVSESILHDVDDSSADVNDDVEYYNSVEKIEAIDRIKVSELSAYVSGKSADFFYSEFKTLPRGLTKPCEFAKKAENIALNRYNGVYAYDHSRVKIPGDPTFFVNACYMDGYRHQRKYIASLGPTEKASPGFRSFWQMVWHEKVEIIVMLTNLNEPSGMKCQQYWPDKKKTSVYGDVSVSCVEEEMYAEYTARTFTVFMDGEQRQMTQFHYTAWPDKNVPENTTSLIEFRQRVRSTLCTLNGPIIVHCSAGIGRTGTYIAIDRLTEEGQSDESVNVYKCVLEMRDQRVNMVQTQEQYLFVFLALVNTLALEAETIPVESFKEYTMQTNNNMFSQMFQQLQVSVEKETDSEKEARSFNSRQLDKNRKVSDIPGDQFRVRLYLDRGTIDSDYINAVYINSFMRKDQFIAAQTPLADGVNDFLCLLYQENVCCIVTMEDLIEPGEAVGSYISSDEAPVTAGHFTMSSSVLERKAHYIIRQLNLKHNGSSNEGGKVLYHFQYTKWMSGQDTPKDVDTFLQFVRDVEEYALNFGSAKSHILVHCLTGSRRSGLFCILTSLVQKMKHERQVCVLNTIRQVRSRRRTSIINMEQLKFCFLALSRFIDVEQI